MRRLPDYIRRKKSESGTIPELFADRVLKMSILSFLILVLGIFVGIHTKSPGFICWSVLLGTVILCQAFRLLQTAAKGEYETVEGMVLKITGRHTPGRFQKIKIVSSKGKETYLLLEKNIHLENGQGYRFYFNKKSGVLSGIRAVDAVLNTGSFYGYEKLGEGGDVSV